MTKQFKVTVIGSSVALRIRPPAPPGGGRIYARQLVDEFSKIASAAACLDNISRSRCLITEVEFKIDRYISSAPDLYVINIGAVDAPTREIPLWFSDIIFKRAGRIWYGPCKWFHTHFLAKSLRKPLIFLRGYRSWVSLKKYLDSMEIVLTTLQKETDAKVVVLGINSGNDRIESQLPGTNSRYKQYSEQLQQLCQKLDVPFVDVSDLNSDEHFPDGVHYNQLGHDLVASRIVEAAQTNDIHE